ncbi:hypothetical protein AY601_0945 [Pedobacter cryoconitis]|uniref:Uncharacterized protein n=1 Tax=Pedobacter cryoconitis TaxID=188932 RepID=A0A127V9A7_9SPHI|nr:hypothetical protein [Pedobacter cryoconitis]AMP97884.1 hypothetical protein AY601_0945 [Pedobacter cryoconitis]
MEKKLKHLEFIQAVITRANSNSFLLKGWAITLVSALVAFAGEAKNANYVAVTFIAIPIFWYLDAYYLALERKFRWLYDDIRLLKDEDIDFSMDIKPYKDKKNVQFFNCFKSGTIATVYLGILSISLILIYVFKFL